MFLVRFRCNNSQVLCKCTGLDSVSSCLCNSSGFAPSGCAPSGSYQLCLLIGFSEQVLLYYLDSVCSASEPGCCCEVFTFCALLWAAMLLVYLESIIFLKLGF